MKKQKSMSSRLSAFALSLMLAVAFMPVFGGSFSFAQEEGDQPQDEIIMDVANDTAPAGEQAIEEATEPELMDIDLKTQAETDLQSQEEAISENAKAAPVREEAVQTDEPLKKSALKGGSLSDIDVEGAIEIGAGDQKLCEIKNSDDTVTYVFKPDHDGAFIFSSSEAGEAVDPVGLVAEWDADLDEYIELDTPDDIGGGNYYFNSFFEAKAGKTYYFVVWLYSGTGEFYVGLEEDVFDASIEAKVDKSTGKATVTGTATGDTFDSLYVDGYTCNVDISGKEEFSVTINMKDYDVGYHDVFAVLTKHNEEEFWVHNAKGVPTYIYKAPTNKLSYYTTGKKKISYTYGGSTYKNCKIILEYKKAGGTWNKTKAITPGNKFTKTKLAVGKKYYVRAYYVATVKYKGKPYTFTGKKSKSVSMKTAAAKPKVKSIKISNAKVSSYTYRQPIYYSNPWGGITIDFVNGPLVKAYQTTVTVTVKLKKKPGAAGIYINGKKVKGNKKVYKTKLTFDGKKKGKKVTIKVYSYQSATYGGNSPTYIKKVKVKK